MRCCICGKEIIDTTRDSHNPYPLISKDDFSSRCCLECNGYVVQARLIQMKSPEKTSEYINEDGELLINEGDTICIFWSKNSDEPTNIINNMGKFLSGTVSEVDLEYKQLTGDWGNFTIDLEKDTYCKI